MHPQKRNRLIGITSILLSSTFGVYLILSNLNDNIVFFYPPSEISKTTSINKKVRVGGLVKKGSIKFLGNKVIFIITDHLNDLKIEYEGMLPALFRENQGIVAEGYLISENFFKASMLLAKHDENYRPPELEFLEKDSET